MNRKLLFFIGLIAISTVAVYGADSDYDFKEDLDRCVEESDALFDGCSENGGVCEFYEGLVNISMTAELTVEQKTTFETFIETCKTEIFALSEYTNEQKFIVFASYLEEFKFEHEVIFEVIQYQNISTWSSVFTVEKVTIIKQQKTIEKTIILDNNDECALFAGIREAAIASGDATVQADIEVLIADMTEIIKDTTISLQDVFIQIQALLVEFYSTHTTFESYLEFTSITGFGSFKQFSNCAKTYKQVTETTSIVTGETLDEILLIQYLQAQFNYYKTVDIKVAIQFNQFIQRVNQSFTQITVAEERHEWFANYCQQWMVLNYEFSTQYIMSCEFGEFGSLYEFIFCQGFEFPVRSTAAPALPTSTMAAGTTFMTEIPSTASSCACVCDEI